MLLFMLLLFGKRHEVIVYRAITTNKADNAALRVIEAAQMPVMLE